MAHENDEARGGCAFGIFFDGRTPEDLLKGGIYSDLALALYSGPFFPVSVALVAGVLGAADRGGRGAFTTAAATRSSAPGPSASDADESLPDRKTLPSPGEEPAAEPVVESTLGHLEA